MNKKLNINIKIPPFDSNQYNVLSSIEYIKFISDWNGLENIKDNNLTFEKYLQNGIKWLNDRKSHNYAITLFSDMIKCATKVN